MLPLLRGGGGGGLLALQLRLHGLALALLRLRLRLLAVLLAPPTNAPRKCSGPPSPHRRPCLPTQCSSTRDVSIDGKGKAHDLGTRTHVCTAVVTCGTREVCYATEPGRGSAQ
ncbi:MAG: hypothetical protein EOP35_25990 [Rubrivivax sp.]|nr:MAG: hypothetical protein EOP35_25990 [Rubrivivax sp.]